MLAGSATMKLKSPLTRLVLNPSVPKRAEPEAGREGIDLLHVRIGGALEPDADGKRYVLAVAEHEEGLGRDIALEKKYDSGFSPAVEECPSPSLPRPGCPRVAQPVDRNARGLFAIVGKSSGSLQ